MLNLQNKITLDEEAISSPNLCDKFTDEDLQRIGQHVIEGYKADKESRSKWEGRTKYAMELAMQVQEMKNFPWPGCSNVKFPTVTLATLQFHSRAYPALLNGTSLVKMRVTVDDPDFSKTKIARAIEKEMSSQLLEVDE